MYIQILGGLPMRKTDRLLIRCDESLKDQLKYICKMNNYKNMSATVIRLINNEYMRLLSLNNHQ